MYKIAIFASGGGSNAESIAKHFEDSGLASVSLILSNKKEAGVLDRADRLGIPSVVCIKSEFQNESHLLRILKQYDIDFIVLAGFLLLIPEYLIRAYPNKIVNIHPALLPKYGGKGMYGINIHKAVVQNKEKETGLTIHFVNERYDEGTIIAQKSCSIEPSDSAEEVATKVLQMEHKYYPETIENLLRKGL
ncbi:MAG: phosphoribosylglycinamide formyltransferase [Bacteroidota bacterium]